MLLILEKDNFTITFPLRDLGLAVIDDLVEDWTEQLINNKLHKSENPKENLNAMLDWTFKYHDDMNSKAGCPVGNLAIEMSEHDEIFREKYKYLLINGYFQ